MEESKDWEFSSGGETDSDGYLLITNDDEDSEYFTSWDMPKFQISNRPSSKQEIEDLERQCNGVPLKLCLVDHGRVNFVSFNKVELPLLP